MRKIREILRLELECGISHRQIAVSCNVARSTVSDYLRRAQIANLSWEAIKEMDDEQLNELLFSDHRNKGDKYPLPDWGKIHEELKKKSVTLQLLWMEYKSQNPNGYQSSQFCHLYQVWRNKLDPCLRQTYKAGEKMFVDYCGQTVDIVDRERGKIKTAQVFVAVLGASNYTYAEATWSQSLPNWIGSHVRAFEYFQGCPELVIPDNLRSGVNRTCRYEPDLNWSYQDCATHFGVTVIPARVRKPRDKAKGEKSVQIVESWILAKLRNQTFFSLDDLNQTIANELEDLNTRPFQKLPGSRRSVFESIERPALKPLPLENYEFSNWKKARVNIDYHFELEGHYYSVPYKHIRQQVEVRFTAGVVDVFLKGKRIASHVRNFTQGGHTTVKEHMPKSHQEYLGWPPERLLKQAESIGFYTGKMISSLLERGSHPAQGHRSSLGILRLEKEFGKERLENACKRAVLIQAMSYKSIHSILKKGLDRHDPPTPPTASKPTKHPNIRGSRYYH